MKKKKKNRFKGSFAKPEYEKVKFKWKQALIMLALGLAAYFILKIFIGLGYQITWILYELICGVPFIVYIVIVRGRLGKIPEPDEIVTEMTNEEKIAFIEGEKARRKKGKVCLYIAFPFLFALLIGFITEYYIPAVFPNL